MGFQPDFSGISDLCAICRSKVQLWDVSNGPDPNGMLILDPESGESRAYHFTCARESGRRWVTVHLGYFVPDKDEDN